VYGKASTEQKARRPLVLLPILCGRNGRSANRSDCGAVLGELGSHV